MNIDKILKKEGIELVSTLNSTKTQAIASKIAKRVCSTFPEHNLNQNDLFNELSKVNMYFADFSNTSIGAKYYYKNQSIYFNRKYNQKKLSDLSIHESIHFIQEKRNSNGSLNRFGLYCVNKLKPTGLALNEAAVQLMTTKIAKTKPDYVKYYGLNLNTPSPDYYPLECALLNQIIYFIGSFPVYHSTLYSDDVFKTTLITKTNKKTYKFIENSFDILAEYEEHLSKLLYSLANNNDSSIAEILNKKISETKQNIANLTLKIQETLLKQCFEAELNKAKDLKAISEIKSKLFNFKNYLIETDDYDFYKLFCCELLGKLDEKKAFIENYGIKLYSNEESNYLPILYNENYGISFFRRTISKTKQLFKSLRKNYIQEK